jgi:2-oxoglutarate dehydrogenase E2 component (dihydrolipoamide succinyltransferase)
LPVVPTIKFEDVQRKYPSPQYNVVKMDTIQRKMAEHMVKSVNTSPHVTVVDEVDVTNIVRDRQSKLDEFTNQHRFKLTFTPYVASAVVDALKQFPIVNTSVEGDTIVYKNFINLGIAVAAPSGLLVPVIKDAQSKSFLDLAKTINDITMRARSKKLLPD